MLLTLIVTLLIFGVLYLIAQFRDTAAWVAFGLLVIIWAFVPATMLWIGINLAAMLALHHPASDTFKLASYAVAYPCGIVISSFYWTATVQNR